MGILAFDSRKNYFDGVGNKVESNNLQEIIKIAKLDYVVEKHQAHYEDGEPMEGIYATMAEIDGRRVTFGCVKDRYHILQNYESFDFLQDLMTGGELKIENAGSVDGGRKAFICASTEPIKIMDDDVAPYILFTNSFDGSSGVSVMLTPIRVFCSNCMALATKNAVSKFSIRHTASVRDKLYIAKDTLLKNTRYLEALKEEMENLAKMRFTRRQFADNLVRAVLIQMNVLDKEGQDKERKRNRDVVERYTDHLMACWSAADLGNYKGTAYAAIQAICDFDSHYVAMKNGNKPETTFTRVAQGMVISNFALQWLKNQPLSKVSY